MKRISIFALLLCLTGCTKEHPVFKVKTRVIKKNIIDELKQLKFKDAATYYGLLYKDENIKSGKAVQANGEAQSILKTERTVLFIMP